MKNNLLNFAVITATIAIPLVGTQANAADLTNMGTIDFFTDDPAPQRVDTENNGSINDGDDYPVTPDTLMGVSGDYGTFSRALQLQDITGAGGFAHAELAVPINNNTVPPTNGLIFNNGAGVMSDAYVKYNFDTPIDLTSDPNGTGFMAKSLGINVMSLDHMVDMTVTITNDGMTYSDLIMIPEDDDDQMLDFFLDEMMFDFSTFTQVSMIEVLIETENPETDLSMDFLGVRGTTSTPEPGTLLGLTFAGVAGLVTRRRRQN